MKDQFYGYYPALDDEIEAIWKDSIIAFDANTLLNIYRYSENTRANFIKVLEHFKDRLWIPYQAAAEYHNNRIDVIKKTERDYAELKKQLGDHKHKIQQLFNGYKRHPHIDTKNMFTPIEKAFDEVTKVLDLKEKKHPEYLKEDKIFPAVSDLFYSKVGKVFSDSELENIYKEGEERYSKKIPPGFADFKKKQNCEKKSLYGDLIIWKELIQKANDSNKKIIFITDDAKEDWWLKAEGKTIGPRPELISEFYKETQTRILIIKSDSFLSQANERKDDLVQESSIQEVQSIRDGDERIQFDANKYYNSLFEFVEPPKLHTKTLRDYLNSEYESLYGLNILNDIKNSANDSFANLREEIRNQYNLHLPEDMQIDSDTEVISSIASMIQPRIKDILNSNSRKLFPSIEEEQTYLDNISRKIANSIFGNKDSD